MSIWAIIVAAGTGSRFGGPKQFELLGNKRVIDISCAVAASAVDGVVVVASSAQRELLAGLDVDVVVDGGATRSESVRAGLDAVANSAQVVVVHDAARPLATSLLFDAVVEAVRGGADGAIPAVPVSDTIKRVVGTSVVETFDRDSLVAVQTPQAFDAQVLRQAHLSGLHATDDAGLVEQFGAKVVVVPGETENLKITTRQDLEIARAYWSAR